MVRRGAGQSFMPGVWVFPGGGDRRRARRAEQCAARELAEETGIELEPERRASRRGRAGSRPRSSRSASTPTSSSPSRPPHSPPGSTARRSTTPAGSTRGRRSRPSGRRARRSSSRRSRRSRRCCRTRAPRRCSAAAPEREVEPILPRVVGTRAEHRVLLPGEPGYEDAARTRIGCPRDRHPAAGGEGLLRALHHHRVHDDRRARSSRSSGRSPPTTPTAAPSIDVTTGLGYPKKADDARRNPRVALLFSDPTGSGIESGIQVLVQGTAEVDERDLDANRERYLRESGEKLPATKKMHPPALMRGLRSLVLHADLRPRAPRAGLRLARRRPRQAPGRPRRPPRGGPLRPHRGAAASRTAEPTGGAAAWDARIDELGSRHPTAVLSWVAPGRLPALGRGCRSSSTARRGGSCSAPSPPACRWPRAARAWSPTRTATTSPGRRTSRSAATWSRADGRLGAGPAQADRRLRAAARACSAATAAFVDAPLALLPHGPQAAARASGRRRRLGVREGSRPACQGPGRVGVDPRAPPSRRAAA